MRVWILAGLGGLAGVGCTSVAPWQRGILALPAMDPEAPACVTSDAFVQHIAAVREAYPPCLGGAGGGCGCN